MNLFILPRYVINNYQKYKFLLNQLQFNHFRDIFKNEKNTLSLSIYKNIKQKQKQIKYTLKDDIKNSHILRKIMNFILTKQNGEMIIVIEMDMQKIEEDHTINYPNSIKYVDVPEEENSIF